MEMPEPEDLPFCVIMKAGAQFFIIDARNKSLKQDSRLVPGRRILQSRILSEGLF